MVDSFYPDDLSAFLEGFPTYHLHSKPRSRSKGLSVFSSKDERYENNSYSSDDVGTRTMIYDQIISAFSKMDYSDGVIFQFWAPVTIGGKHLLSTSGQPFAVSHLNNLFLQYRRLCVEHVYDIDVNSNNSKFRGTPASEFLNRFPEIAFHSSVNQEVDPFLRNAFQECRLMTSYLIPICCPSQTSSSSDCIGVIECSSWYFARVQLLNEMNMKIKECRLMTSYLIPICCPSQTSSSSDCIGVIECSSWYFARVQLLNEMNMKIKEVGLSVRNTQDRMPYRVNRLSTINGLKLARDQIQEALKIVCQSHHITLAQVWIASLDENHVHSLSSWEDAQTRRVLGLKLTGCIDEDSTKYCRSFQYYHDACDLLPLQPDQELVLKTLQDYEPRFCKNIPQLGTYKFMGWDCTAATDAVRSLTICMRNLHTGDFNYVFEFLWISNSFYPTLLEKLLLKIKRCLPSFKFASGTEIGDTLHVTEVGNHRNKKIKKFDIFQLKRLSSIPEALKEGKKQAAEAMNKGKKAMVVNYNACSKEKRDTTEIELSREDIEQHYGKTMKKAAEELGVSLSTLKRKHSKLGMSGWQGPDLPQRKAYNSNENQSNDKDNGVIQDPSPVKRNENTVIKAELADDIIKLHLGISEATFVTVENDIGKKFKLKHGTFKIKYLDEDEEWILMTSDQDLSDCIQNSRNVDRSAVRLRVLLRNH
ncbi:NIN-like protein [Artemisia annua]|uniref:NIN-like protein n=1 Tax=Artemisia annua TaxID=35608 RepID=A0A2U1NYL0_ARTAN|nr:NIN-like protein [Artemisia annua]